MSEELLKIEIENREKIYWVTASFLILPILFFIGGCRDFLVFFSFLVTYGIFLANLAALVKRTKEIETLKRDLEWGRTKEKFLREIGRW